MAHLVIVRGLPGSGKTTFAETHFPHYHRVAADDFMVDEHGTYKFQASKLPDAHAACQGVAQRFLAEGRNVVVHNTFVLVEHMMPYFQFVNPDKDHVTVFRLVVDVETSMKHNIHGCPWATIERMHTLFEDYENELVIRPNWAI